MLHFYKLQTTMENKKEDIYLTRWVLGNCLRKAYKILHLSRVKHFIFVIETLLVHLNMFRET